MLLCFFRNVSKSTLISIYIHLVYIHQTIGTAPTPLSFPPMQLKYSESPCTTSSATSHLQPKGGRRLRRNRQRHEPFNNITTSYPAPIWGLVGTTALVVAAVVPPKLACSSTCSLAGQTSGADGFFHWARVRM